VLNERFPTYKFLLIVILREHQRLAKTGHKHCRDTGGREDRKAKPKTNRGNNLAAANQVPCLRRKAGSTRPSNVTWLGDLGLCEIGSEQENRSGSEQKRQSSSYSADTFVHQSETAS
jgi:hypothetical protein